MPETDVCAIATTDCPRPKSRRKPSDVATALLVWNASMSEPMQRDRFRYPITKRERAGCGDSRCGDDLGDVMSSWLVAASNSRC